MNIIQKCSDVPDVNSSFDNKCIQLFDDEFVYVKILGKPSGFGIAYEVYSKEYANKVALKVTLFNQEARQELMVQCSLQKISNPCFLKIFGWFLCTELPPAWRVRPPPSIYASVWSNKPLIYFISKLADTNLQNAVDDRILSFNDVTCIIFECLVALYLGRKHLKLNHNDLKLSNVLLEMGDFRNYEINSKVYKINSNFHPIIADFGLSTINEIIPSYDVHLLVEELVDYINDNDLVDDDNVELYDNFVSSLLLNQSSNNTEIIMDALQSKLFSNHIVNENADYFVN